MQVCYKPAHLVSDWCEPEVVCVPDLDAEYPQMRQRILPDVSPPPGAEKAVQSIWEKKTPYIRTISIEDLDRERFSPLEDEQALAVDLAACVEELGAEVL